MSDPLVARPPLTSADETTPVSGVRRVLRALGGPPREMLLGAGAAIVSMVPIAWFGRNFWFRYDGFLLVAGRRFGSLNDWFRPHHDHWLTWTVLFVRALHGTFGMDYWPWWYLPRLIGHAAIAYLLWRVVLHRGASKAIAAGAYATLLVLALSYFLDGLTFANYVVFPCMIVAALIVCETDAPRRVDLVAVGVCLGAAVMSNGYGVAGLVAVAVVVAAQRRLRRWALALVVPFVMVGVWYAYYHGQLRHHDHTLSPTFAGNVIDSSFVVVRTAVENTFGLLPFLAAIVVFALIGGLLGLLVRRRLDAFDATVALTLVFVLAILAWARTTTADQAESARYGYAVAILLALLVVPHLRMPSASLGRTAVAVVLIGVVGFNAVSLTRRLDKVGADSRSIRAEAETTAALITAREPYLDDATIGRGIQPRLIRELIDGGWHPHVSLDPAVVKRVRTHMRMILGGLAARRAAAEPGNVPPRARGVGPDGCIHVKGPKLIVLHVTGRGAFDVNRDVAITWSDRFATLRVQTGPAVIALAQPNGRTKVTVRTLDLEQTDICSLARLGH